MSEKSDPIVASKPPSLAPYRGTRDFYPEEMSVRTQTFKKLYEVLELYGFARYDGPLLEHIELYIAKSSQEIVNEQLFTLVDKADRKLAIRPEMTPTAARMIAGKAQDIAFPARWYAHVNCHRYERPQRGRVREHWQINADIFGSESAEAEVELFDLIHSMMAAIGAGHDQYLLRVSDRSLMEQVLGRWVEISPELIKPVFREMDRWEKIGAEARVVQLESLGLTSIQIERLEQVTTFTFEQVCEIVPDEVVQASNLGRILTNQLTKSPLHFDPLIVRGFDYYTSTVFEVFDRAAENRRSLFGGGRYDNLTSLYGKSRIVGVGFGMGDVTLFDFLETHHLLPPIDSAPAVYVCPASPEHRNFCYEVHTELHRAGVQAIRSLDSKGMGKELKLASKMGAKYAVIVGLSEAGPDTVAVRDLSNSTQAMVSVDSVADYLRDKLATA